MDKNFRREFQLSYRNEETGQWHVWYLKPDRLEQAAHEADLLIKFKGAVEVKAVEIIMGDGWEHKREKEVLSLRLRGQHIETAKGLEMTEEEVQEIARKHEFERQQEIEMQQEIEIEQEGYGYSM